MSTPAKGPTLIPLPSNTPSTPTTPGTPSTPIIRTTSTEDTATPQSNRVDLSKHPSGIVPELQ